MKQSRQSARVIPRGLPGVRLASASAVAMLALGCGGDRSTGAMTADLERDLAMATSAVRPQNQVVSAIEGGPTNAPSGDQKGRRDDVVRPKRAPRATPTATEVQEAPAANSIAEAPAPAVPEPTVEVAQAPTTTPATTAPAPKPTWGVIYDDGPSNGRGPSDGRGDTGTGTGRTGGGWGGTGVIIRGGGAGEDHCEPRGGIGRRGTMGGGTMGGGGIIGGIIGGIMGGTGGMGRPRY